jgi:superfamily II DNA or RNA helicase
MLTSEVKATYDILHDYLHGQNDYLPNPVASTRLKDNIKWFAELRQSIIDYLSEDQVRHLSSNLKSRLQQEANQAHKAMNRWGMICMATGTGKSKTAIDAIVSLVTFKSEARVLIVVPTAKLRDRTWAEEFKEWGYEDIWNNNVEKVCYASLVKKAGLYFDFVVLDECHNITENSAKFFQHGQVGGLMALTATEPEDWTKRQILEKQLRLKVCYKITLDEAVDLGVVAPYEITIITTELDSVRRNVKIETKAKTFYTTEAKNYEYYSKIENSEKPEDKEKLTKFFYINRMKTIYNLQSKLDAAQLIVRNYIPKDQRTLIFCGSIDHAEKLCLYTYHSKSGTESYNDFVNQKINILASVEALNEGDNLPMLDIAFIQQLNSKALDLIQRIGRVLRFRPGHTGRIIILCVKGTVDEKWTKKAIAGLNQNRIRWITFSDLVAGKEILTFKN